MYTRCPICKTNFSISEAQLQVAQGKVRCGSCKNVFNARQHIYYQSSSSAAHKNRPKETTSSATTKKPDAHVISQAKSPPRKEAPKSRTITTETTPKIKHAELFEPSANSKSPPPSSIDAIFNALDSQLTSGTYIDIAKPVDIDIREADFDFDDDSLKQNHPSQQFDAEFNEPDLNPEAPVSQVTNAAVHTPINDSPATINASTIKQKSAEKKSPQHTFDFANISSEPDLSSKDEKQLSEINTPLKAQPDLKLKEQDENAALHQAIDNIIKVDSHITTPFEEHDDDHFVIEMETPADVELVDEDDIDKLFASTDSLKISDLKFDKHLTNNQTEEPISRLNRNNTKPEMESAEKKDPPKNETPFNLQVEEQLKPAGLEAENSDPENLNNNDLDNDAFNEIDFGSGSPNLDVDTDNFDIEEEIVLTSPDSNPGTSPAKIKLNVPHRLRDAVTSFDQQTPSLSLTKRLLYSFSSLLLMLLLAAQLVLFKSTALANSFPTLQPVLTSLCNKLPCRYTGNHDSRQIKIISRDVRLHPKIKGALLISATIINQANYAQPYPTILLKFTDLTGNTVAQRYFSPKDYLGLLDKPFALMPSKKPVQLNIEILDPGSDAINFQFFFL